ncbi:hypothetical protein E3N88_26084 [Mikania micrantha]|uniref:Retrovirus-related Pol polyprotein from transposon TNT 1-94-like beta-barrel domain-containing protein n=1 Tax=Mikania micrantha TaxID=192012 RepID=A0A5N6N6J3_9ASTR|nr:hypothetical protein E3N88_26084 [Mikania micrantha]
MNPSTASVDAVVPNSSQNHRPYQVRCVKFDGNEMRVLGSMDLSYVSIKCAGTGIEDSWIKQEVCDDDEDVNRDVSSLNFDDKKKYDVSNVFDNNNVSEFFLIEDVDISNETVKKESDIPRDRCLFTEPENIIYYTLNGKDEIFCDDIHSLSLINPALIDTVVKKPNSKIFQKPDRDSLSIASKNTWYIDSGCSRHMTGNLDLLTNIKCTNGGFVKFAGNTGGYIAKEGVLSNDKKVLNNKACYIEAWSDDT